MDATSRSRAVTWLSQLCPEARFRLLSVIYKLRIDGEFGRSRCDRVHHDWAVQIRISCLVVSRFKKWEKAPSISLRGGIAVDTSCPICHIIAGISRWGATRDYFDRGLSLGIRISHICRSQIFIISTQSLFKSFIVIKSQLMSLECANDRVMNTKPLKRPALNPVENLETKLKKDESNKDSLSKPMFVPASINCRLVFANLWMNICEFVYTETVVLNLAEAYPGCIPIVCIFSSCSSHSLSRLSSVGISLQRTFAPKSAENSQTV